MSIRIVNLTVVIEVDQVVTLSTTKRTASFSGVPIKFKNITFLVFRGKKIVSVGGTSEYEVKKITREFLATLSPTPKIVNFTVKNKVGSLTTGRCIDLGKTYETIKISEKCIYEPELFAALYIYTKNCLVTLFHTGKVIFTGTQDYKFMNQAWDLVVHKIQWKPTHSMKNSSVRQP